MQPKTDATVTPSFSTKIKSLTVALERFEGDPRKWQNFWESFCSAGHKDESLPVIMKFHRLNSLLEEKAAATIGGLSISGSTYREAIELLEIVTDKSIMQLPITWTHCTICLLSKYGYYKAARHVR